MSNSQPGDVSMGAGESDRLHERQRFIESVARGRADADAGRTIGTRELRRRLAPPSPQASQEGMKLRSTLQATHRLEEIKAYVDALAAVRASNGGRTALGA